MRQLPQFLSSKRGKDLAGYVILVGSVVVGVGAPVAVGASVPPVGVMLGQFITQAAIAYTTGLGGG